MTFQDLEIVPLSAEEQRALRHVMAETARLRGNPQLIEKFLAAVRAEKATAEKIAKAHGFGRAGWSTSVSESGEVTLYARRPPTAASPSEQN